MKLRAVWLHNIRSYRDQVIVFPERGITVIYGDVGTGKSTILSSITFAIFGSSPTQRYDPAERYAAPKAEDLLRRGATRGFVQLWLRLGDCGEGEKTAPCRDVIICRNIVVEGGSVRDKGGSLIVYNRDEGRVEEARRYSAVELRNRVLQILGLPEKERGSPLIFTNAIYVPQFNVYSILTMSPQERKETINRALNLVKYNNIRGNIEELARHLRLLVREKRAVHEQLIAEIGKLGEKKRLLEEKRRALEEKIRAQGELKKKLEGLESARNKLLNELRDLAKLKGRYDEISRRLKELEETIARLEKEVEGLGGAGKIKEKLQALEEEEEKLRRARDVLEEKQRKLAEELSSLDEQEARINEELKRKREELDRARREASSIEGQVKALDARLAEVRRLVEAGKCPTCEQPVTQSYGETLTSRLQEKIDSLSDRLKKIQSSAAEVAEELSGLEELAKKLRERRREVSSELRRTQREAAKLASKLDRVAAEKERILKAEETARRLEEKKAEAARLGHELEELKDPVDRYARVEAELGRLEEEIRRVKENLEKVADEAGRLRGEIAEMEKTVAELEDKKREAEELAKDLRALERMLGFVKEREHRADLVRIVEEIESYVKRRAHQIFQYEFRRLFSKLMEGQEGISVEIDQDFTPIYRISIGAANHQITLPSGGQVASVGLAYRLALNTVARAMVPQLSRGLLILDEPTYGFSPERVEKLREMLEELDAEQIIIVTHDQNLLPAGHYHIRLSLDRNMVTRVEYEGFAPDELERVKKSVTVMRRIGCSAVWAGEAAHGPGGFKPAVKSVGERGRRSGRPGTLLDYVS